MISNNHRKPAQSGAFILLEVILAVALFGMISVGFTAALQQIALGALRSGDEMRLQRMFETFLTEASKVAELEPGDFSIMTDENGVYYSREIEELELENMDGRALEGMFRVAIRAQWDSPGGDQERLVELIRYEPLYQNTR